MSSPAFRAVVRRAVRESHRRIISESGQRLTLTLADGGVLLRSALAMHPQLAEKVPSRALSILETQNQWLTGKGLGAVLHTGQRLRRGAAVLLLAGCVSCGLGFSLARRRDPYLLQCGLARFQYRGPVTPPWPTLRTMIASDQGVVVFAENDSGEVPWYHPAFEVFQETPYRFKDPAEFSNQPGRGGTSGSLLLASIVIGARRSVCSMTWPGLTISGNSMGGWTGRCAGSTGA